MKQFKINKNYTNRSEESLDKYLVEINRIPMITPDQEVELAQIIRKDGKKGEEAKNKLVTANLRFVVSVAKQYQHQGVPLSDLINEGNLGLITAAKPRIAIATELLRKPSRRPAVHLGDTRNTARAVDTFKRILRFERQDIIS